MPNFKIKANHFHSITKIHKGKKISNTCMIATGKISKIGTPICINLRPITVDRTRKSRHLSNLLETL